MPVSLAVCETTTTTTANVVNAALRESLLGGSRSGAAVAGSGSASSLISGAGGAGASAANDDDSSSTATANTNLQNQIVASAKRVLLAKIEYEEVENYNDSVLDNLKTKYVVIKSPTPAAAAAATNNGNSNSAGSKILGANGHDNRQKQQNANGGCSTPTTTTTQTSSSSTSSSSIEHNNNPNELPKPKRVLYQRENIRIGWKQSERKWQIGAGMINVGNTCYLNSTLQALFHIPALANWLNSEQSHLENCNIGGESGGGGGGGGGNNGGFCIICAMAKTLQSTQSNASAIRPYHIYSKLKQICKHMVIGRQEDAHEFLRFLVEAMEKAYLMRYRNYKELDQLVKETTPLNQIFGGYLRSEVRCLSCNHVSITFQHFQDLLLDIRKSDTLDEAFDGYFSRERLEDMGYKCEGCKKKVSATKQFSLQRAPITLCIQLKRFSMIGNKLTKQISFKPRIDLSRFAARSPTAQGQLPLTYRLVSLVTHLGVSQHCGHYTAIGLTESGSYYNFDDSYVRPIAMQSVCSTNSYIMFYELDLNQPLATPANKLNGLRQLSNGHHHHQQQQQQHQQQQQQQPTVVATIASSPMATTRFIGPQLPPGGLNGYAMTTTTTATNNTTNGHSQKTAIQFKPQQNGILTVGSGKFQESGQQKSPLVGTNHKNEAPAVAPNANANANGKSSSNPNTNTTINTNTNNGNSNNNNTNATTANNSNKLNQQQQQYLPMSSSDEEDSDEEKMKRPTTTTPQLPSMPKMDGGGDEKPKTLTLTPTTTPTASTPTVSNPLKRLVPYESASEEEESSSGTPSSSTPTTTTTAAAAAASSPMQATAAATLPPPPTPTNARKRSLPDHHHHHPHHHVMVNGHGKSPKPASMPPATNFNSSSSKQKTDAIDEIFKSLNNFNKKRINNKNQKHNEGDEEEDDEETLEKETNNSSRLVSSSTNTSPTTNGWKQSQIVSSSSSNSKNVSTSAAAAAATTSSSTSTSAPPSPKTPPSPAVINSKTGLWKVTRNLDDDDDEEEEDEDDEEHIAPTPPPVVAKTHKNPFSSQQKPTPSPSTEAAPKRQKLFNGTSSSTPHVGNGYQSEPSTPNGGGSGSGSNGCLNELLKQSHRGYGSSSVLSWNGKQTELDKELTADAQEQRQRDLDDDEENEMDRGRQRKVKTATANGKSSGNSNNTTPGYNPFQEYESQKRWHNKSSNGPPRFYTQHASSSYRSNFHQRNKFKCNRGGNGGGGSGGISKFDHRHGLQRHLAAGGGFPRRPNANQQQQQQQS
ncbi:ubiquitin carboxyl-terminal hydrolase 36 isoform X1 [Drosophila willistoni]|uniref:ubiquitin carboxyl-terminal hydrolase 36 isoform X1 n=1 Tax=Drosophila willistoni TaxID=7260 RepID=UPI001F0777AE|nr:ubiquitin carboxyl-terminal hydrolase 36 isoform X1 [Drosophila willistoni]